MIQKTLSLLFLLTFLISPVFSQDLVGCDGARYRYLVFEDFEKIEDVVYGSNIAANGSQEELEMDMYMPYGDSLTNRPVIIIAHGGFFLTGNNEMFDVVPLCEDFAKMGYVVLSINYRLGIDNWLNLEESFQEAVLRGMHDGKAAVRFIRKVYFEQNNPWGIDPNRILFGGSSAGAFVALHLAYLDLDEIPEIIDLEDPGLGGGIEGLSGNQDYSSDVTSIFNISGALGDYNWIDDEYVPIVSTHGTNDNTVPYGAGSIQLGFINVDEVDGSELIHSQVELLDIENCFHTFYGADHVPHQNFETYYDTTLSVISGFNSRMVCPIYDPICGYYDYANPPEIEEDSSECPQDIVEDGMVNVYDMLLFLSNYGCVGDCIGDFNGTGNVSISDVLSILSMYGAYCE